MRLIPRAVRVVLSAGVVAGAALPSPASAQSFFELIFGSSAPSRSPGAVRTTVTIPPSSFSPYRSRVADEPRGSGGNVRTVCVRLCDGYYWPISFSIPRHRVSRDADICATSCTSEARVFMTPTPNGEIAQAHDLTGRSYKALSTAFVYRKRQVSGCTCRPAPWSVVERQRHYGYALAEGLVPVGGGPGASIVAGRGNAELAPPEVVAGRPAPEPPRPVTVAEGPEPEPAPLPGSATADLELSETAVPIPVLRNQSPKAPVKPRAPRTQTVKVTSRAAARKLGAAGGSWTMPQAKYAWPGDAPVRYR